MQKVSSARSNVQAKANAETLIRFLRGLLKTLQLVVVNGPGKKSGRDTDESPSIVESGWFIGSFGNTSKGLYRKGFNWITFAATRFVVMSNIYEQLLLGKILSLPPAIMLARRIFANWFVRNVAVHTVPTRMATVTVILADINT